MVLKNKEKMFAYEVPYDQVDPDKFIDLLNNFKKRIEWWYIKPGEDLRQSEYSGFTVMGISCIIIDTLCGYRYGIDGSTTLNRARPGDTTKTNFISFCKEYFPKLKKSLPTGCQSKYQELQGKTYADVLYESYRCKILHESRIPYYGGISQDGELIDYDANLGWILINPHALLQETKAVLDKFINQIKTRKYENEFKKRFRFVFNEINTTIWGSL